MISMVVLVFFIAVHFVTVISSSQESNFCSDGDKSFKQCSLCDHHGVIHDVVCLDYTGYEIDELLNRSKMKRRVGLQLVLIDFPNQKMPKDWYKDKTQLHSLEILSCSIQLIESNAFNSEQFRKTELLSIRINQLVEIELGAFNGLMNLKTLTLQSCAITNPTYRLLEPIAGTLRRIMMLNIQANMYNLIGGTELRNVEVVAYSGVNLNREITPNTFTMLPKLWALMVPHCEIEVITANAFDRYADTLESLLLRNNKLKTLPSTIFDGLRLEAAGLSEYLIFDGNPWECTCDLIQLQEKYSEIFHFVNDICAPALAAACTLTSESIEFIDVRFNRRCNAHYGTNSLRIDFTSRFRLKLDKVGKIYVKSRRTLSAYYLIISRRRASGTNSYCVRILPKYVATTLTNNMFDTGIYSLCVLEEKAKRSIWPLNCVSFTITPSQEIWIGIEWKVFILIIATLIYSLAFSASLSMGIQIVRKKLIFLYGVDRIVKCKDLIVVLPKDWKEFQQLRGIKYGNHIYDNKVQYYSYTVHRMRRTIVDRRNDTVYVEELESPIYQYPLFPNVA